MFKTLETKECSEKEFISYWKNLYDNKWDTDHYKQHISKNPLNIQDLSNLFTWKNGMNLSDKKRQSLETKILSKIDVVNQLKIEFNQKVFDQNFQTVSTVWKIMLLHVIDNKTFPIFDQHTYRSYWYLKKNSLGGFKELDTYSNHQKYEIYFQEYLPFMNQLKEKTDYDIKSIDESLMSYGQFLKSQFRPVLS